MSKKSTHGRRQGEISEAADKTRDGLREKLDDLGHERDDVLITRETLDQLEAGGTDEGAREVLEAIEHAERGACDLFDQDGCVLEDIHREGQEQESGLQEGCESVERDIGYIIDASGRINVRENVRDLELARDRAVADKEFLERHIDVLNEAIRQSEADYSALKGQVHAVGEA